MSKSPKFINPYNFIPLGKDCAKGKLKKQDQVYSGVIEYQILTKTPLFIPNTSNHKTFEVKFDASTSLEDREEHKAYDFFSYHDHSSEGDKTYNQEYFEPVIPGSEIRGMLRSTYEILTNSCMSVLDENVTLSKRTNEVFKSGLLKKTAQGYELYEAVDCLWRTKGENNTTDETNWKDNYYTRKCYRQKDFREGEKVYFECKERGAKVKPLAFKVSKKKTKESLIEGYLILGEDGPVMGKREEKHCAHIFKLTNRKKNLVVDISLLEKVIAEYQDEKKPNPNPKAYQKYAAALKEFKNGPVGAYFPVYYSVVNNKFLYMSPASKTREVYHNKLEQMIKNYQVCEDSKNLCPACSLFGIVGQGKKKIAVASRLRFADLRVAGRQDDYKGFYDEITTLAELSSPKLNNMEFYMKKPAMDAVFWTYDYYIDGKQKVKELSQPEINGRKFYWHNLKAKLMSTAPNKRNVTIRPLKKGILFDGKLYFDKISKEELHSLIWLLNVGEDCGDISEAKQGYKLGAAKPLGLGSIAMHVNKVTLRCLDITENGVEYEEDSYEVHMDELSGNKTTLFNDNTILLRFKKMTDFNAVKNPELISYPTPDGQPNEDGYEWFTGVNHKAYRIKGPNISEIKSPNERVQETFTYYMEPMKEMLFETSHPTPTGN